MIFTLCSDLHLREDTPACRTDDYLSVQNSKLKWLREYSKDTVVICAGDIFHRWKSSPFLISVALDNLPHMLAIPGQHDLPYHSLARIYESAYSVLVKADKIKDLSLGYPLQRKLKMVGVPFGGAINAPSASRRKELRAASIIVLHRFCEDKKVPFWAEPSAMTSAQVFERFPNARLIVTGDNHRTFSVRSNNGQWHVNPGSLMRMTADQREHIPTLFKWNSKTEELTHEKLPVIKDCVSREKLDKAQERDARMEAFVESLDKQNLKGIDLADRMRKFLAKNKVSVKTEELLWTMLERD